MNCLDLSPSSDPGGSSERERQIKGDAGMLKGETEWRVGAGN